MLLSGELEHTSIDDGRDGPRPDTGRRCRHWRHGDVAVRFGAGTLAGHFDPVLQPYSDGSFALGQYTFVNTVFGVGSTTFSGGFAHADPLLTGAFNGLFAGPNAQELMARWSGSYFVQGITSQPEEMFGVWVGRKP
jgi:hypothetical protein